MKTIVCYGDSNTWGYKPEKTQPEMGFNRFGFDERWKDSTDRKGRKARF